MEEELTVPQVAAALGISRQRVYQLIAWGRLPGTYRVGRNYVIPASAVEARLAGDKRIKSNQCITANEVADFFGVNVRTVREWHANGDLVATKIDNVLCFSPGHVVAFVPRTYGSSGRYPERTPTRTLRGRTYPPPEGQPERNRR